MVLRRMFEYFHLLLLTTNCPLSRVARLIFGEVRYARILADYTSY